MQKSRQVLRTSARGPGVPGIARRRVGDPSQNMEESELSQEKTEPGVPDRAQAELGMPSSSGDMCLP